MRQGLYPDKAGTFMILLQVSRIVLTSMTSSGAERMSALPPKADMCSALRCPLSAKSGHRLFHHLIGQFRAERAGAEQNKK